MEIGPIGKMDFWCTVRARKLQFKVLSDGGQTVSPGRMPGLANCGACLTTSLFRRVTVFDSKSTPEIDSTNLLQYLYFDVWRNDETNDA